MPWLAVGMYAVGTAGLAALGRAWATDSGENALAARYVIHSIALVVSLVGLVALEAGRWRGRHGAWTVATSALVSVYALWLAVAWNHGRLMMGVWESARLRAATSALFYNLQEEVGSDEWVPRNMGLARRMNDLGLLRPALLTNGSINNFRVEPKPASSSRAAWTVLRRLEDGTLYAEGYARLPGNTRVADGVIFSMRDAARRNTIIHVAHVSRLPLYLGKAIGRDLRFVHHQGDPLERTDLSGFETQFELPNTGPEPVVLSAWVFDYRAWAVTLIDRYVVHPRTGRIEAISRHAARNDVVQRRRWRGERQTEPHPAGGASSAGGAEPPPGGQPSPAPPEAPVRLDR
jgi:hypothetical protein